MRRMRTPSLPALQAVVNMQDGQEMFGDATHPGCIPMRRMGTRVFCRQELRRSTEDNGNRGYLVVYGEYLNKIGRIDNANTAI
jgi:hypothetical protein